MASTFGPLRPCMHGVVAVQTGALTFTNSSPLSTRVISKPRGALSWSTRAKAVAKWMNTRHTPQDDGAMRPDIKLKLSGKKVNFPDNEKAS
ncbi:hypothetical protein DUNSADRAFT_15742 [Dunaliella salina]|uniref:Encoded protein n=1 Tax=Dunaliella salina TaxID=3046 RepID=A0ABQ7H9C1_DUNSA|nr:hypothetical protein DUNSADRAFT_15742 [Dunaliella salina]|eukprot:KAF5843447.1 hypothetical protein DUNSADRAFT_15742 [Dunaliella salina]